MDLNTQENILWGMVLVGIFLMLSEWTSCSAMMSVNDHEESLERIKHEERHHAACTKAYEKCIVKMSDMAEESTCARTQTECQIVKH